MAFGLLATFIVTLTVGNALIPREKAVTNAMLGHDFLPFYTAGLLVRQGQSHDMYRLEPISRIEHAIGGDCGLELGESFGPWWNPPFYALVFEPLSLLSYPQALAVWRSIGLVAVALATWLLIQTLRQSGADWRSWALLPACMVVSMPFIQTATHGQNTYTSLLLLTTTAVLWRGGRTFWAGIVCGLLFYKPQLGAVVAAVLMLNAGLPAVAGLVLTGVALLVVTVLRLPGTIADYLHLLPANVRYMQIEHVYLWERHVTLKAFWRLLLQGRAAGEPWLITSLLSYASLLLAGGALAATAWHRRGRYGDRLHSSHGVQRDRLIAATIATMPLLMPFYFDYDLLLLAIPLVLYVRERIARPDLCRITDRWLSRSWVALYLWLFVNPGLAQMTRINLTVVLLSAVASQLIIRALSNVQSDAELTSEQDGEILLRQAA